MQSGGAYNYTGGFSGFTNDTFTRLVDTASSEPDTARRKELYSQLNDFLLDQCFTDCFSMTPSIAVMTAQIHGLQFELSRFTYVDAWLA